MGKSQLSLEETREMLIYVSREMVASVDLLTQADKAIGDGDHGVGMARGFEAVRQKLENQSFETLDGLFRVVGTTLMTSVGGAAGVIFGTWFREGARGLGGQSVFDSGMLSRLLHDGLHAVQARGRAQSGDKTMVDALEPAARRSRELASVPLDEGLISIVEAARGGMEATKDIVAQVGKAKTLGARSLGYADPGAISVYLILKCMGEYVTEKESLS